MHAVIVSTGAHFYKLFLLISYKMESGAELNEQFPLEMTFCSLSLPVRDGFVKLIAPLLKQRHDVTVVVLTRRSSGDQMGSRWDVRLVVSPVHTDFNLDFASNAISPVSSNAVGAQSRASAPVASRQDPLISLRGNETTDATGIAGGGGNEKPQYTEVEEQQQQDNLPPSLVSLSSELDDLSDDDNGVDGVDDDDERSADKLMWVGE